MPNYLDNRIVGLSGEELLKDLRLVSFAGREEISRPFRYELRMVGVSGSAADGDVNPDKLLGKSLTVTLENANGVGGDPRHFNGVITEFAHTGFGEQNHEYYAVIQPAFWLLSQRTDCRLVQKMSTLQIFDDVCRQAGGVEHRQSLNSQYKVWEQRVQYHESDFDFLSRMLELEGIYYYFEHQKGKHTMVLVDDVALLKSVPDYDKVRFEPAGSDAVGDRLETWVSSKTFQSASYATRGYDFEKPTSVISGTSQVAGRGDSSQYELFEYLTDAATFIHPGAERIAKVRAQRLQSTQSVVRASGDAAGLAAGRVFSLIDHPVPSANKKYVVLATEVELGADQDLQGRSSSSVSGFSIKVELIDAQQPYRPAKVTPKPRIQGTQTAVVVSDGGAKDISTDKYGRVKVQFHWDRVGAPSGWARVAQGWAGQGWGAQQLPRVGQEVVVSFLDGDPDAPIVIGSVYNGGQMPPYTLPDQKTRSGVKSRSVTDGTAENFNEIRFEDKKGEEEIYLHAEKNLQVVVENNQTITVGAVKKDKGDRSVTIQNDDTLTVGNDRKVTVSHNLTTTVTENGEADIGKNYKLTAGEQITLKVGLAQIVMKKDGTIEISGKDVKVDAKAGAEVSATTVKVAGTAKIEVEAPQTKVSGTQLDIKGTQTAVEGTGALDLASSGIATLKGSLTKIG